MKIVIVGCGRVGAQLASLLSLEGHEIAIVDRDAKAFERLPASFRGQRITGVGFDREVLRQAGIERADAFVSVTSGDNTNIVAALMARREFHVPNVVTRVFDPQRAEIYRRFGIPTISPTTWAATEIKEMLVHADLSSRLTLGSGEVEIIEIELPPTLIGHAVSELAAPGEIMVITIVRQGKGLIPFPGAAFQEGDDVYLAVLSSALGKLKKLLGWA
jgi:trk system potassium uptake protein TrkA